jgi:hypothetical protein
MTTPQTSWVIDCGHWHCVDRYDTRHGHDIAPDVCEECAEERPQSDRARELAARAASIAALKHPKPQTEENKQ